MKLPDPFGLREKTFESVFLLAEALGIVAQQYKSLIGSAWDEETDVDSIYLIQCAAEGLTKEDVEEFFDEVDESQLLEGPNNTMTLNFTIKSDNAVEALQRVLFSMFVEKKRNKTKEHMQSATFNIIRADKYADRIARITDESND